MDQGLKFIDESTLKGKIPSPYQDSFVNDLLEAGSCICGASIPAGSEARENVKKLLEKANTALINQKVMKARSVAANLKGRIEEFLDQIRLLDKEKSALDKVIGEEERALKDLESELSGIDEESIKKLTTARERLKAQEKELLRTQGALKAEMSRREEVITKTKRDLAVGGAERGQPLVKRLHPIKVEGRLPADQDSEAYPTLHLAVDERFPDLDVLLLLNLVLVG